MTEEIRYYEEELSDLCVEIQKGLDVIAKPKIGGAAKLERIDELGSRLQRAKQVLHSFKVEMRDLAREQSAQYDIKAREFQQRLTAMHSELQLAKQEAERQAVGVRTVDEMTTQEVFDEAGKVQGQSLSAVERMKRQIEESKEVGAATAVRLKGQTEQLKNIDVDIQKVSSNLKRADLLLRAFMRKMVTDKIIMVFMCLIFVGVLVIIVWKIVDPCILLTPSFSAITHHNPTIRNYPNIFLYDRLLLRPQVRPPLLASILTCFVHRREGVDDANLNVPNEVVDPLRSEEQPLPNAPVEGAEGEAAGRQLAELRDFVQLTRQMASPGRSVGSNALGATNV